MTTQATYVPGTLETDQKKINQSIQQIWQNQQTDETNIATNTTNIATNTTNITALQTAGQGLVNSGGSLAVSLSKITASLGSDVLLNNAANYFDGPSIAQGTSGTWWVSGTVTVTDTGGISAFFCKLWDGTTVIASATTVNVSGNATSVSLSGFITSPAGNLRISVRDSTAPTGKILFNTSGNSKDSTISAIRIA